jgi:hypothetical protein
MITGAEFVSASQRRRRVASIEVSSRFSPHSAGRGYMVALKRLLQGGVNLVRLHYTQFNWECLDIAQNERAGGFIQWSGPPQDIDWLGPPQEIQWSWGTILSFTPTTDGGFPAIEVSGFTPGSLVALPGEYVVIYANNDDHVGTSVMVLAPAVTNAGGAAVIRLTDEPPAGSRVSIGGADTGVFRATELPRSSETMAGDFTYSWNFEEVFADEGRGPFEEVDPWN